MGVDFDGKLSKSRYVAHFTVYIQKCYVLDLVNEFNLRKH